MKIFTLLILSLFLSSCLSLKKLESAKSKAISYLDKSAFEMDFILVYSYLQQSNELPDLKVQSALNSEIEYYKNSKDPGDSIQYQTIKRFWRLVDRDFKIPQELYENAKGVDSITVKGLYCDQIKIDTNIFFQQLRDEADALNYSTSHALLSLIFLKKNNCYSDTEMNALNQYLDIKSLELLKKIDFEWNDLNIETLAFRSEADFDYQKSWIKQILKAQQEDGGWKGRSSNETSNSHTTILAIWLIQNIINDLED